MSRVGWGGGWGTLTAFMRLCVCFHQIEEKYKNITVKDESPALRKKINELTVVKPSPLTCAALFCGSQLHNAALSLSLQDNQRLKQDLLRSQTKVACLHSEMDSLKTELTDQTISTER